jgi:uncharacterized protein (DUF1800 family)/ribosomal protein L35AE/L33A
LRYALPLVAALLSACGNDAGDPPAQVTDPPGTIAFASSNYSVAQSAATITLLVSRTDGATGAISAAYASAAGTASTGVDFTNTVGTLNWADGDTAQKSIVVPILTTGEYSGTRAFSVTLSAVSGGATLGTPSSAAVSITGTATPTMSGALALSAASYSVAQNAGTLVVTVKRSNGSDGAVQVSYATVNGTAKAGTDYTATSGTLNWANADMAAKTFSIPVSNATPFAGTKSLNVNLSAAGGGATLGTPSSAAITINGSAVAMSNGIIAIGNSSYTVAQGAGALSVSVTRTTGSSGAVSVAYATANGTAVAGTDYTATSGTLNWASGDGVAKTISVPVSNAAPFSGTKTFTLAISAATGGAQLGTPASTAVTITGSGAAPAAGTLALSTASYAVAQNAGSVALTVSRTNGSAGAVSVRYATANDTATAGTEYTATSGTLNWAAGDIVAKTITVPVSNATPFQGSRSFTVTLNTPAGGATLGAPLTASVSISGSLSSGPPPAGAMGEAAAARLLMQGTFGATLSTVNNAAVQTYDGWFASQAAAASKPIAPRVPVQNIDWKKFWFTNAVQEPDQLRQRMAFALSEILVVSTNGGPLYGMDAGVATYHDMLSRNALGNFRTLLEDVTLSPAMGRYLSHFRNNKFDPVTGVHADENYAREIMQLFSVGLVKLNPDGTVQVGSDGIPLPTYDQSDVTHLANVFTGWASAPLTHTGEDAWIYDVDLLHPMVAYANHHDTGAKTIIGGVQIPAGGTAASDMKIALDTLFNHPNVGPFISRQLIQRLVTSNPSPAYVQRVAQVFNDNGQGTRGDLLAVAKAILTDAEARTPGGAGYGKLREPLIRLVGLWRAFGAHDSNNLFEESDVLIYGPTTFAQMPLHSPSVFNFFRPEYRLPGPLTDAGLVTPEFQITNEATLALTANLLQQEAYQYVDSRGTRHAGPNYDQSGQLGAGSVMLYTSEWENFAATPATLVDKLNLVFMAGQMPAAMRTTLIDYAAGIPADQPWARVVETTDLLVNSPQYAIQR